jgi:hypothetical protein
MLKTTKKNMASVLLMAALLVFSCHGLKLNDRANVDSRRTWIQRTSCLTSIGLFPVMPTTALASSIVNLENYPTILENGYRELLTLDRDFDAIIKGGGDAVRRRVGTVGTGSSLFSFEKRLKECQVMFDSIEDDSNFVDLSSFLEASIEVVAGLRDIDFLAYSSIFADASGGAADPGKTSKDYEEMTHVAIRKTLPLFKKLLAAVGQRSNSEFSN